MRGSRIPNPMVFGATVVAATLLPAVSPRAADYDPAAPTLGKPVVLFSPNTNAPAPTAPAVRGSAPASPAKRPVTPVQRIPLDGKQLIPPAAEPAKLGPPLDPQPALSLETDLQPVGPAAPIPAPPAPTTNPAAQPPAPKSPPG
jgi:hypothetical protein